MKKQYVTPELEFIFVDDEDLLTGTNGSTNNNYGTSQQEPSTPTIPVPGGEEEEEENPNSPSGAKIASWTFSVGEDW